MIKAYHSQEIPYLDPLELFQQLPLFDTIAFLHSSLEQDYAGKYSAIALFPVKKYQLNSFKEFESKVEIDESLSSTYFSGGWITTFSYDLKNELEKLPKESNEHIKQKNIYCVQFGLYIFFNKRDKTCTVSYKDDSFFKQYQHLNLSLIKKVSFGIQTIKSNFTKKSYLNAVNTIKNYIFEGDIFEANLTRKFFGKFSKPVSGAQLFIDLINRSPSQYSAFLKFDDFEIISSSPERFIKIKNRTINSKPIKGTRPRGKSEKEDLALISELKLSEKDRAENLMIVDLVRNDIGKIAEIGSVIVPDLFKVESYETVHQLVSTVEGKVDKKYSIVDAIKACFPPGSMTGAPKIRAMEICTEIETYKRGIYSGAIGYIGFDGYIDLSVVIRSIIKKGKQFEFQVGGAIVSDSDPEAEFQETLDKARAICSILDIDISTI